MPPREWMGRTAGLGDPAHRIIKNNAAWGALWKKHAGGQAPQIDFSKYMVIAVFQTRQSRDVGGVAIIDIKYDQNRIVIEYSDTVQADAKSAASELHTYHMKLIETSELPVVFLKTSQ